jgi:hypothetical protein
MIPQSKAHSVSSKSSHSAETFRNGVCAEARATMPGSPFEKSWTNRPKDTFITSRIGVRLPSVSTLRRAMNGPFPTGLPYALGHAS